MQSPITANHARTAARWALLVALGTTFGGCQVWNAWLDALKWRDLSGGKNPKGSQGPLTVIAKTPSAPTLNPVVPTGLVPRVTVFRITIPVGSFSSNDKIWAQLNEDAIDSQTAVLMAQNGLRAATGDVNHWPAIAKLLDTPGASNDQIVMQTDGRSSINVVTRQNVTDQIVVSVDRDLQQQGRTFERCDNGFRLSMRGVRNKPELQVQLEPIVTLGTVELTRSGGPSGAPEMGVNRTGFSSEETFEDLRVAATLTASQFLVISAADPKASPFSVGTLWLSDAEKVPATETVLVFVPTPSVPVSGK